MTITLIQILIIIFALFALTRAMLRLKDNIISMAEFVFWSAIWIGVITVTLVPSTATVLAGMTGISSGTNMIMYLSIILLFYLVFRIYVKLDDHEQRTTKLIREMTINNHNSKKKNRR